MHLSAASCNGFRYNHSFLISHKYNVCFYSRARDSTSRFVRWLVGGLVTFYFFFMILLLLLPKWSSDLKYGPFPPARDFGSRVSGLVS